MRYAKFSTARRRLIPVGAVLLATALAGCVAYPAYPTRNYGYSAPYSYPNNYNPQPAPFNAGYPAAYNDPNAPRPFYSPDYNSAFHGYDNGGGGR
jgi:hypothetical protein